MTAIAPQIKTLVSVDLRISSQKRPLAVAQVENSKIPVYFNTHDPEKIRQGLRARAIRFTEKSLRGKAIIR